MIKFIVLFTLIAVAYGIPANLVATPLLAKVDPQPEAPADTEHATHVTASIPIAHITYAAAPAIIAHPLSIATVQAVALDEPLEKNTYKIVY